MHLFRLLLNVFFYGHLQIALAAALLGYLTVERLKIDGQSPFPGELYVFLFMATLGVYTLHRLLSFRRAGGRPRARRYAVVRWDYAISAKIGACATAFGVIFGGRQLARLWPALVVAVPITYLYLTPLRPGWRRLRDVPYLKVVWVGIAWTLVTHVIPVLWVDQAFAWSVFLGEGLVRFAFTTCVALLFDLRDVELDRGQGVKTVANDLPEWHRHLTALLPLFCVGVTLVAPGRSFGVTLPLALSYLVLYPIIQRSYRTTEEDWYAVGVNGVLMVPPVVVLIWGGS